MTDPKLTYSQGINVMARITCGSLIRRAGGPSILGTAGCLVQWPGKTDQLLLLTAARVLVGRTAEQFEAIEAVETVDQPGKPIGCLYAWSDLKGTDPTTTDVALVHVSGRGLDERRFIGDLRAIGLARNCERGQRVDDIGVHYYRVGVDHGAYRVEVHLCPLLG
jgi:hypothetical protein